jgi:hypothetical protein
MPFGKVGSRTRGWERLFLQRKLPRIRFLRQTEPNVKSIYHQFEGGGGAKAHKGLPGDTTVDNDCDNDHRALPLGLISALPLGLRTQQQGRSRVLRSSCQRRRPQLR